MTVAQLRSLTLRAITAECPVEIAVETPEGVRHATLASFAFERTYSQTEPKRLLAERLVLHAIPGGTHCGS
jgi:hypothetical protein